MSPFVLEDELQQLFLHHFSGLLGVVCGGVDLNHRIDISAEGLVRELRGKVVRHQLAVDAFGFVSWESGHDSLGVEVEDGEREPEVVEVAALLALVQRAEFRGDELLGLEGRDFGFSCIEGVVDAMRRTKSRFSL